MQDIRLDRLHDLALPPEVGPWPLAPGWWVVIALVVIAGAWIAQRAFVARRRSAYRREALRELDRARTAIDASVVLRRCALVVLPREAVAALVGDAWADWLRDRAPIAMPREVRDAFAADVYRLDAANDDDACLAYAREWVRAHRGADERRSPAAPTTTDTATEART